MQKGIINQVEEISKEGKKTFYSVKLQDGAEMSTFDSKIKQAESGDGLEFDVIINGKYINLKDGFIITKSASSVTPHTTPMKGNGHLDMSKEDWAEKQRVERASIEAQTAVKCIFELNGVLISAGIVSTEDFLRAYNKALAWCKARLDVATQTPTKAPPKATPKVKSEPINPEDVEFDGSPVRSLGDLWTRCKNYNINRAEGLQLLELDSQEEIIDLDESWKAIFEAKFGKQEEANVDPAAPGTTEE